MTEVGRSIYDSMLNHVALDKSVKSRGGVRAPIVRTPKSKVGGLIDNALV